jgi:tetratricopeptide (TPR) repeat protein
VPTRRLFVFIVAALAALLLVAPPDAWRPVTRHLSHVSAQGLSPAEAREAAYRANNLGVALLEQFKHAEGAEQFRRALKLDPQLALAHINLAVALYNVPDTDAASRAAADALALAPTAPQPLYIQALIARSRNRTDEAVALFRRVLEVDPRDTGANVNLGQLHAQQRNYAEAERAFRAALDSEPYNNTALYGLANVLLRTDRREEGQRLLQQFQNLRQTGAGTSIGTNYLEQGRYAEAVTSTGAERGLVERQTPDVTFNDATASVLPAATATPTPRPAPQRGKLQLEFVNRQQLYARAGGGATLFDYDADGDLDLFEVTLDAQRLYRNDGGKFVDVTNASGALAAKGVGAGLAAVAGDYDNDTRPDLFVLRDGRVALYHNEGAGKFSDATAAALGSAPYPYLSISAAFADVDHDGDLDLFIAGYADLSRLALAPRFHENADADFKSFDFTKMPAPNRLLRNNGNGTFTDITSAAKVSGGAGTAVAVVPTDYDNRRDVDLLVVNYASAPALYRKLRDGTFRDVAREVGLDMRGRYLCAAAGDVNKDGYTDFFFGADDSPGTFALSDGRGRFNNVSAPAATASATVAQFLDYDNDGLLDLLTVAPAGARLWRNLGGEWAEVTERAVAPSLRPGSSTERPKWARRVLASGDADGDGDTDIVLRDAAGKLRVGRNDGGNRNRALGVRLAGRVSNRSGVESKVEMRAGSLWQKLEVYAAAPAPAPADLVFGLGRRERADAVRVLWPSGTVQSETEFPASSAASVVGERPKGEPRVTAATNTTNATLTVTELDRKPSSCPYLFAWNGERFEFITDFMGGGELGYWVAPGVRAAPDPDEYVRIRGDQLRPRAGRYELRVTNELEEVLFMDKLELVAVAHPAGVEVYPGEGLGSPLASEFRLFSTRAHDRPPRAAFDEHGHDVRARIAQLDRSYPDDFSFERVRGYAAEHSLTLDLGEDERAQSKTRKGSVAAKARTLLLLTGWTDYAFSSDNVAAAQRGLSLRPPALQVRDARGRWQTVIEDIGVPVGRPQTVVVDLTGKFLSRRREVRIVTNMRIYWDQILVDTAATTAAPAQLTRLAPVSANLNWRGFSAQTSPDGREPYLYDYARVSYASPWKVFTGRYTREGDVGELVREGDDMFVISRPGDELSLSFDANALAPLPRGWTRTFLLYADGYSKEMDINSASPEQVAPLPFRRMREYPYKWPETYPHTPAHLDYLERYNTRIVGAPMTRVMTSDR